MLPVIPVMDPVQKMVPRKILVTPPLGTLMYASCSIVGVPVHKFSKEVIPFLFALFAVLFLITFVPIFVLFLPKLILG